VRDGLTFRADEALRNNGCPPMESTVAVDDAYLLLAWALAGNTFIE